MEEHNYIDRICRKLNSGLKAVKQNLIIKDDKKYDVFTLEMDEGRKRKVCFDITSFFIR